MRKLQRKKSDHQDNIVFNSICWGPKHFGMSSETPSSKIANRTTSKEMNPWIN